MNEATAKFVYDIAYALRFKAKLTGKRRRELDPQLVAAAVADQLSLMWKFERKPPLAPPSVGLRVP